jgi:hypothetical protein
MFWVLAPRRLVGDVRVSEKHTVSIFRAEVTSVLKMETVCKVNKSVAALFLIFSLDIDGERRERIPRSFVKSSARECAFMSQFA